MRQYATQYSCVASPFFMVIRVTSQCFLHKPTQLSLPTSSEYPTMQIPILKQTASHCHWQLVVSSSHRAAEFPVPLSPCFCTLPRAERGQDHILLSAHTLDLQLMNMLTPSWLSWEEHEGSYLCPLFLYSRPCLPEP